jgi:hypothetical protein
METENKLKYFVLRFNEMKEKARDRTQGMR